eukprot:scaffold2751_cov344-Prasinococcus_capsulatus_cf.AAC.13
MNFIACERWLKKKSSPSGFDFTPATDPTSPQTDEGKQARLAVGLVARRARRGLRRTDALRVGAVLEDELLEEEEGALVLHLRSAPRPQRTAARDGGEHSALHSAGYLLAHLHLGDPLVGVGRHLLRLRGEVVLHDVLHHEALLHDGAVHDLLLDGQLHLHARAAAHQQPHRPRAHAQQQVSKR